MTESQTIELKELRADELRLKEIIQRMESELNDTEFDIKSLEKWKKGRWHGFAATVALLFLGILAYLFFLNQDMGNEVERYDDAFHAIGFATTTVSLMALTLILIFLTFVLLFFGVKLIMELGSSKGARALAKRFNHRNYYSSIEPLRFRENDQRKEIINLRADLASKTRRIKELESLETPWYEQTGQAKLNYYNS